MSKLNPENKCADLPIDNSEKKKDMLVEIFETQKKFQNKLQSYEFIKISQPHNIRTQVADLKWKATCIKEHWNNLCVEYGELMERLPYKSWKKYDHEKFVSQDEYLEILYEYIDMFHFFINIGLILGLDPYVCHSMYMAKNKENFNRQNNNY